MKKVTITLFAFSELSKAAQKKALADNRTINVEYEWQNGIIDDAAKVGLDIKHFDVDHETPFANGEFHNKSTETAKLILYHHSQETNSYKLANDFLKEIASLEKQMESEQDRDIKIGLNTQINIEKRHFKNSLLMIYAHLLKSEFYHRVSNEAIIEKFNACEMTFEKDGRLNNSKGDEQEEEMPIGIMDFNPDQLSIGLVKKLMNHKPYTYEDTSDLQEHLYSPDVIAEHSQDHAWVLNDEEEKELHGIQEKMNAKNCGYFRMIVI